MDDRNYWEELAGKAGQVDVQQAINKWSNTVRVHNCKEKHDRGCRCAVCDPATDVRDWNRPEPVGVEQEVYKSPYTPEETKAYFQKLKEEDRSLPHLEHPEFVSEQDTAKAIREFHDYEEGDLLKGQVTEVVNFHPDDQLDGILVFYIDVGSLSPVKAEALVDRMRIKLTEGVINRMPSNWTTMWIPVREQGTSVEAIRFNG